jgi:hypothetical protein
LLAGYATTALVLIAAIAVILLLIGWFTH